MNPVPWPLGGIRHNIAVCSGLPLCPLLSAVPATNPWALRMMTRYSRFRIQSTSDAVLGLRAGLPVALGYLPVAFAFGAAASAVRISAGEATGISALMYSGANQAFLLTAIATGMPVMLIILLGAAASLRHVLYGLVLRRRIGGGLRARLFFGYGLTDEVFATALNKTADGSRPSGPWLTGLAFAAWSSWVFGTTLGGVAGGALRAANAEFAEALEFALPALFLGLVWVSVSRAMLLPMALAGGLASACILAGAPQMAIPAGALAALVAGVRQ